MPAQTCRRCRSYVIRNLESGRFVAVRRPRRRWFWPVWGLLTVAALLLPILTGMVWYSESASDLFIERWPGSLPGYYVTVLLVFTAAAGARIALDWRRSQ